ncbi:E3 ubiquitin-protein ligase RKP [Arabidopsis thaliana]|uniref:RING-type E3 ubiquitin transferase n=2 Tax=Arabidopsis TaxID=3701 RepID=A0A178VZB5_ARATH|nr:SPRY domain [Arabidopsis thaliana x Arabidopsis arenosa]OAP10172.1 RKP [Arabidopsis thaliana]
MAEDSLRVGMISSGLAVLLNGEDAKENSSKARIVPHFDYSGHRPLERTIEFIFGLAEKSVGPLDGQVDSSLIRAVIKNQFSKLHGDLDVSVSQREGISVVHHGVGPPIVGLEEFSICGDIRIVKPPLVLESLALFSSARANACIWKGKWMYEVALETSGIQQLGWATLACPFTDQKGVGDADDSYAFDGRRVSKWNKEAEPYGQSWVAGDVIGCCIDLNCDEIYFYRNGVSLGAAFTGIRKLGPGFGYYPAISLSQGERCELNFGAYPFKYPVDGFQPLQEAPTRFSFATELLRCFSRLLDRPDRSLADTLSRLRRFASVEELFCPVSSAICDEFFYILEQDPLLAEYLGRGAFLSFLLETFRTQAPHDSSSLDKVLDVFLEFPQSQLIFEHVVNALACGCKTATLILTECPYSGPYPYLALACHLFKREELMVQWWRSLHFEFLFEGFLSCRSSNKHDLQHLMPVVWWPGSSEDISYESSMGFTISALSEAINKIEEKQRNLCLLVIQFIPPVSPPQLPGSAFRGFLQNLLLKNRGADRTLAPSGVTRNSVLVSLFSVILHFLSEGFAMLKSSEAVHHNVGFLHRGGQQKFPLSLFLKSDPHRADITRLGGLFSHISKSYPTDDQEEEIMRWEEGCMDDEQNRVTHATEQKPCCCLAYDTDLTKSLKDRGKNTAQISRGRCSSIPERSSHVAAECSAGSFSEEIDDKPSTSNQSDPDFGYRPVRFMRTALQESRISSAILSEEELLDALLLLYHIAVAPNFKQASYYMSHQSQSISLLEETDKQIRERASCDQIKRLKEARNNYKEDVMDCVRHSAWFRISLFSRWKQRGMYALCMWVVQLLLVLSKMDSVFVYIPEFYLESLVDCFHVLRKSDPPFVPSTTFIKQGLSSFITFVVTHFNDSRISNTDLKDLLLQSISVLVQYKEYLEAFENNEAATRHMPAALLAAFDNRSWIPVTNIFLRLCKGSGFSSLKNGESSFSSTVFQALLRDACINDGELLSTFLNRLFNTLSWTITEFSVSVREMQEKYQVMEFQQRKCCVIFELSSNLARVLEFCTYAMPQAFLAGTDTNLRRLTELILFILNHMTSALDDEFFDLSLRRQGQPSEKVSRGILLAPLVGIILNLLEASEDSKPKQQHDVIGLFASMDCPDTVYYGFQYLLEYNWDGCVSGDDAYVKKLGQLENFLSHLINRASSQEPERKEESFNKDTSDTEDNTCCICYAGEANAMIAPCSHRSCYGCITRHLLNCQRCFFCNATVIDVIRDKEEEEEDDDGHKRST